MSFLVSFLKIQWTIFFSPVTFSVIRSYGFDLIVSSFGPAYHLTIMYVTSQWWDIVSQIAEEKIRLCNDLWHSYFDKSYHNHHPKLCLYKIGGLGVSYAGSNPTQKSKGLYVLAFLCSFYHYHAVLLPYTRQCMKTKLCFKKWSLQKYSVYIENVCDYFGIFVKLSCMFCLFFKFVKDKIKNNVVRLLSIFHSLKSMRHRQKNVFMLHVQLYVNENVYNHEIFFV